MNKLLKNCFIIGGEKTLYSLLRKNWECIKHNPGRGTCSLLFARDILMRDDICNPCRIRIIRSGIKENLSPREYEFQFISIAKKWGWWENKNKNAVSKSNQEAIQVLKNEARAQQKLNNEVAKLVGYFQYLKK